MRALVVCGPSGAGKGSIIRRLGDVQLAVSHTTRLPRSGEVNGREYHFVDRETFQAMIARDEFVEHAQFGANLYGTSRAALHDVCKSGKIPLLDLDIKGCIAIRERMKEPSPYFMWITAPSTDALRQRLKGRGSESDEEIEKRIAMGQVDEQTAREWGHFDAWICNDVLDETVERAEAIVSMLCAQSKE